MDSNLAASSTRNELSGPMPVTVTWQMANPNVDNSSAPPPSKKKGAKKAPSNKSGKKG